MHMKLVFGEDNFAHLFQPINSCSKKKRERKILQIWQINVGPSYRNLFWRNYDFEEKYERGAKTRIDRILRIKRTRSFMGNFLKILHMRICVGFHCPQWQLPVPTRWISFVFVYLITRINTVYTYLQIEDVVCMHWFTPFITISPILKDFVRNRKKIVRSSSIFARTRWGCGEA